MEQSTRNSKPGSFIDLVVYKVLSFVISSSKEHWVVSDCNTMLSSVHQFSLTREHPEFCSGRWAANPEAVLIEV